MAEARSTPAAPAAGTPMPLFFRQVVPLDANQHGGMRLDREAGFRFAARTNALPLGIAEFDVAAQHYPIVFSTGALPMPVALVGYREDENLFVDEQGAWRKAAYQPAYVRSYPFVFIEDSGTGALYLGVESTAECLGGTKGVPLFEQGRPSAGLNDVLGFCNAYRENLRATREFSQALADAGLLEERNATINFVAGGNARLDGFQVVNAERFNALGDATFLDWRKRGWIAAIHAHLFSAGRWGRIIDLATELGLVIK